MIVIHISNIEIYLHSIYRRHYNNRQLSIIYGYTKIILCQGRPIIRGIINRLCVYGYNVMCNGTIGNGYNFVGPEIYSPFLLKSITFKM